MNTLNTLERAVLEKLLSGETERYRILQTQLSTLRVTERKLTGVGFFTRLSIPHDVPRLPDRARFQIGDVSADMSGLERGAGFVLFIEDGQIDTLEGYTYGEPWPQNINSFHLYYDGTSKRQ